MKTWVEVSKANLAHNFHELNLSLKDDVRFMAIVKSNAYGHDMVLVAKLLSKISKKRELWFGVDSLAEAIALREVKIKNPILILGYVPLEDLAEAIRANVRLTIYNLETAVRASRIAKKLKKILKVHIKIDTGTTRQGVGDKDLIKFARAVKKLKNLEIEGIGTHYANIEDTTDHSYAALQLKRFKNAIISLKKIGVTQLIAHSAASAAVILFPETHFNMIRVGISLYGMWPSSETRLSAKSAGARNIELKPVLTWKTKVAQLKTVSAGTPVSYGLTEKVVRATRVAVLPVGYFDGYDRKLASIGNVLIRGVRCKVLGRVCMNMMMVDATDVKGIKLEDEAVLLGTQKKDAISAEELARKVNTINYEIVTRINPLISRILI